MVKKLDGNYTKMLRAILNKSWSQHPTKQQLYGHRPPITKTVKIRQTRHGGHCWRSRDVPISDVFMWTPSHGRAKARRPATTYIPQLCADTGCNPEDLPKQWTIGMGGERGSRISVLMVRRDDDDELLEFESYTWSHTSVCESFALGWYIIIGLPKLPKINSAKTCSLNL